LSIFIAAVKALSIGYEIEDYEISLNLFCLSREFYLNLWRLIVISLNPNALNEEPEVISSIAYLSLPLLKYVESSDLFSSSLLF